MAEVTIITEKFGEVTVRNAMFDTDGTNLEEGIEIKGEEIGLVEIYGYHNVYYLEEEEEEVEKLIEKNL